MKVKHCLNFLNETITKDNISNMISKIIYSDRKLKTRLCYLKINRTDFSVDNRLSTLKNAIKELSQI